MPESGESVKNRRRIETSAILGQTGQYAVNGDKLHVFKLLFLWKTTQPYRAVLHRREWWALSK